MKTAKMQHCEYCGMEKELAEREAELKVQSELAYLRLQSWEKEMAQNRELRGQLEKSEAENAALTKQKN